jgi:hypothetical protein
MTVTKTLLAAGEKTESEKSNKSKLCEPSFNEEQKKLADLKACPKCEQDDCECYPKPPATPTKLFHNTLDF